MKNILLVLIVAILSVSFVGCGSSSSTTETSANNSESIQNESNSKTDNSSSQSNQSEKKEYKVGDAVTIAGEELTVTDVQRNYKTGNEYIKPGSGNEFIKVIVTIKNNSDDTISVSPFEFKVLDGNGVYQEYKWILNDPLDSLELATGGTISGALAFEVPKDDANLKLVYTPSYFSDEYVEVKI